jgi:hypothetical protein
MDLIYLAQDRDQWRVLMNTEMNLRAPLNAGNSLATSEEGLSSVELDSCSNNKLLVATDIPSGR